MSQNSPLAFLLSLFMLTISAYGELLIVADRFLPNETVDLRIFYPDFNGDTVELELELGLLKLKFNLHSTDSSYYLPFLHGASAPDSLTVHSEQENFSEKIPIRSYLPPPSLTPLYQIGDRHFRSQWQFTHSNDSIPAQLALSNFPEFPDTSTELIILTKNPFILERLLLPESRYYFRARGIWQEHFSSWSATDSFFYQPKNSPPGKPFWESERDSSGLPKLFTWQSSRDIDGDLAGYELHFIVEEDSQNLSFFTSDTFLLISESQYFQNHKTYRVLVSARDSLGESSDSDTLIWRCNLINSPPQWLDDFSPGEYLRLQTDT
ncbi:MAG TPA: hypothetical protein ENN84_05430, partial [Candidatus Marinimicrobia bacterium]|nr:hypothetical protein [Candidatus Neomarinimicrobiota bacterium]